MQVIRVNLLAMNIGFVRNDYSCHHPPTDFPPESWNCASKKWVSRASLVIDYDGQEHGAFSNEKV